MCRSAQRCDWKILIVRPGAAILHIFGEQKREEREWPMYERCCPTCKQTIPSKIAMSFKFTPRMTEERILEIVKRAGPNGILSCDLFEVLYANDKDGGPLGGLKSLSKRIARLNHKLAKENKRIVGEYSGQQSGHYKLVILDKPWVRYSSPRTRISSTRTSSSSPMTPAA